MLHHYGYLQQPLSSHVRFEHTVDAARDRQPALLAGVWLAGLVVAAVCQRQNEFSDRARDERRPWSDFQNSLPVVNEGHQAKSFQT
jgi:hypothetical protein